MHRQKYTSPSWKPTAMEPENQGKLRNQQKKREKLFKSNKRVNENAIFQYSQTQDHPKSCSRSKTPIKLMKQVPCLLEKHFPLRRSLVLLGNPSRNTRAPPRNGSCIARSTPPCYGNPLQKSLIA